MNVLKSIWETLKGHKTYIIAIAAVVYGTYAKDAQIILIGLGLAGIRNGISTEVAKVLVAENPVQVAEQDAPAVAAQVVTAVEQQVQPVVPAAVQGPVAVPATPQI